MKSYLLSSILCLSSLCSFAQQKLTQLWESKEQLPVPESVLFVPERSELFVSLIDGDASAADGKGGIAILNLDGSLKNAQWVEGLNAPKGMALYKDMLYVADIDEVVVIDIITGNVINQIPIEGSSFLNDVTVDASGRVYVSDTRKGNIHVLQSNKPTLYMSGLENVNGLRVVNGNLFALVGPELWKFDNNKQKTVIAKGLKLGGDGLEPVGDGSFLVTCWGGLIYHIGAKGELTLLLDVQGKMNTADLGYNPKDRILYVPTFLNNSVVAYRLN